MRLVDNTEYKQKLETAFEAIQELRKTVKYDLPCFDAKLGEAEAEIRDFLFLVRTREENLFQKATDRRN